MKHHELFLLLIIGSLLISYIIGRQDGKLSEQKAILERLEEVDSIYQQDSIKQQRNNKTIKTENTGNEEEYWGFI